MSGGSGDVVVNAMIVWCDLLPDFGVAENSALFSVLSAEFSGLTGIEEGCNILR